MSKAAGKDKRERERRQTTRAKLNLLVAYGTAFDLQTTSYLHDIGRGGIFIRTENPLEIGALVDLEFTLPETFRTIRARAKVTWSKKDDEADLFPPGMGLSFLEIDSADQRALNDYVDKLLHRVRT